MNYDTAHALVKAMRESEEYKGLMESQAKVQADTAALAMAKDFMNLQIKYEYANMAQAPELEEIRQQLEEKVLLVNNNALVRDYLQAQMRWSQVSQDIYRIIAEPLSEGMKILED